MRFELFGEDGASLGYYWSATYEELKKTVEDAYGACKFTELNESKLASVFMKNSRRTCILICYGEAGA